MLGQVITNFPQYSVGTYGYTIQVDLTYLYASSIDIIQLDNNGVSSLPITQKTALVSLQGYINDIACPNIAYSVDSDILTLFVKTSAYPYTDPINILAGVDTGGVYLSIDEGVSWNITNMPPQLGNASCFTIIGTTVFVPTQNNGVYSSDNLFLWFNQRNTGLDYMSSGTTSLGVSGSNLFCGQYQHGAYVSTNLGVNWTAVGEGISSGYVWALIGDGTHVFAGTLTAGGDGLGGIWKATDNIGTSWSRVGLSGHSIYSLKFNGLDLWAAADDGTYLSIDNGVSWNKKSTGLGAGGVTCISFFNSEIWCGMADGAYLSIDNGDSWVKITTGMSLHVMSILAGNNLYAATLTDGVYKSTNRGINWVRVAEAGVRIDALIWL